MRNHINTLRCVQLKQVDSKYLLRIKDVNPMMDNGNYTCVVSNRLGEIRATIELLVMRSLLIILFTFSLKFHALFTNVVVGHIELLSTPESV